MTGICAQCELTKRLEICRDGYLICRACNDEIAESLRVSDPVECFVCMSAVSWLWGKFNFSGQFMCRSCIPCGLCNLCRKKRAITHLIEVGQPVFVCGGCADANK